MNPKIDNNARMLREYVALAEPYHRGRGFVARYGYPGGLSRIVYSGQDQPAVFDTEAAAENEARRVLVESLNSRYRFGSKRDASSKMTGDEFAAELAETGIPLNDFATMWGTKQGTVHDWITGAKEVPFALRWVLRLLRRPGAIEEAQKIVAENTTVKPEWIKRQRQRAENQGDQE